MKAPAIQLTTPVTMAAPIPAHRPSTTKPAGFATSTHRFPTALPKCAPVVAITGLAATEHLGRMQGRQTAVALADRGADGLDDDGQIATST